MPSPFITMLQRVPRGSRLRVCISLCNTFQSVPDTKLPRAISPVFAFMKKYIASVVVPSNANVGEEYARAKVITMLVDTPPPRGLPSGGAWFAFAKRTDKDYTSSFQIYIYYKPWSTPRDSMCAHCEWKSILMPCIKNKAVGVEDAHLLINLATAHEIDEH